MSGIPITPEQQVSFERYVGGMKDYLKDRDVLYVNYNELVTDDPRVESQGLQDFVPELDLVRALSAINKSQYRNRK